MAINKNISDEELVEKLRKGDHEAFDAVFGKYGNRLFGFALKYLRSKEEAEGLVQDVFLESALKTLFFQIAEKSDFAGQF